LLATQCLSFGEISGRSREKEREREKKREREKQREKERERERERDERERREDRAPKNRDAAWGRLHSPSLLFSHLRKREKGMNSVRRGLFPVNCRLC
jgi:hypothetical protein